MDFSSCAKQREIGVQRRLSNPFLLQTIQDWAPTSPVATTKDEAQPSSGNLRTLHSDPPPLLQSGLSGPEILKCKNLDNEDLIPVLRKEVKLSLRTSKLLLKRSSFSL